MQEQDYNIISKYLSGETSSEENNNLKEKLISDKKFKESFDEIKMLWGSLNTSGQSFDKERILKLIKFKISNHQKQKRNKILYSSLKYAAVFIGLLIISISVYRDLHSVKVVANNTENVKRVVLPDNTVVTLNKQAEISWSDSDISGFNREITLKGEAFFEVAKMQNRKFVVKTDAYNITVLGTKFNVRTYPDENSVVLKEGKVLLSNFKNADTEIIMKPGEIVKFSKKNNAFVKENINPEIYTSWMKKRLEFDDFSLSELAELLKIRYNKILIVGNNVVLKTHISGSAPSDDVYLIVKALKSILKTDIKVKNDTIIIN